MIKPPILPASFVDSPVTPHEAQQAHAGVEQNGNRIQSGLMVLLGLNVLSVALTMLGMWWLERSLPDLLQNWGIPMTPSEAQEFQSVINAIPGWFWAVTAFLSLLATAINVWCLNVIRKAIAGIQNWTLEPTHDHADDLMRQARTVRPWITLGQWFPVITGILMTLFYVVLFTVAGMGTGADTPETVIPVFFSVISSLIGMLPGALIAWLGLGAVKRWLDAVVTRTSTPTFPVRPFARSLDGWLIFSLVLLVLGLLNVLAGTAMLAFMPWFINSMAGSGPTSSAPSDSELEFMRGLGNFMMQFAWFGLLGVAVYALLALLVYWSRNFVNSVARLLDANRPAPSTSQDLTPSVPHDW